MTANNNNSNNNLSNNLSGGSNVNSYQVSGNRLIAICLASGLTDSAIREQTKGNTINEKYDSLFSLAIECNKILGDRLYNDINSFYKLTGLPIRRCSVNFLTVKGCFNLDSDKMYSIFKSTGERVTAFIANNHIRRVIEVEAKNNTQDEVGNSN